MVKKYEAMHELPTENTGGWKDCSTDEVGLLRLLLCGTQHKQRGYFILNSAEAHRCYNQMHHIEISMSRQSLKLYQTILDALLTTIQ